MLSVFVGANPVPPSDVWALAGGVLVLLADVLGRIAVLPSEMPVGIVTAFVGAPVLIGLARRRRATAL
ncbi:iron chelate uptake ABC transporter family permease subunit [Micromonospora sp. KC207]|uniref:iron chelate uptake ABC transporter family permease subunit n=1 Tax=Micromonospora sp. KC207 TaxID=2530377 RepID=UPI001FB5CE3D|nr:iron chelate uptake ABC transporter family permease subunit [Micromonospora sp. KC207]